MDIKEEISYSGNSTVLPIKKRKKIPQSGSNHQNSLSSILHPPSLALTCLTGKGAWREWGEALLRARVGGRTQPDWYQGGLTGRRGPGATCCAGPGDQATLQAPQP